MLTAEVLVAVAGRASCVPAKEEGTTKAQAEPTRDAHTTAAACRVQHKVPKGQFFAMHPALQGLDRSYQCAALATACKDSINCSAAAVL
jgi:hypothetical protein